MKSTSFIASSVLAIFISVSCSKNKDFMVAKNQIGKLNSKTTVLEIESLFKNDSVVKRLSEGLLGFQGAYTQDDDKYLIYAADGKHLLTITPKEPLDSLSTIRFVDVYDERYKTKDGIGLSSTFEEINLWTTIDKIETTFTKATLYLTTLNATMTLDKKDLGIRSISTEEIFSEQIPNLVKPTSFVLWFEE